MAILECFQELAKTPQNGFVVRRSIQLSYGRL